MTTFPEQPASGGWWRLEAAFHERERCRFVDNAAAAERVGNADAAKEYRGYAERHRLDRDRKQAAAIDAEERRRIFRKTR
jgi:hypothetical protein